MQGRQRPRSFARKPAAVRFLTLVQADLLRGSYVDPGRSRTALSAYAASWLASLSVRPSTRRTYHSHLRTWILPVLGGRMSASITPTDVRTLAWRLTDNLALSTAHPSHGLLSSVLRGAVEDGYLARNPAPRTAPRPVVRPLTGRQVHALPGQPLALRPPKKCSSARTVPLPDTVAAAIGGTCADGRRPAARTTCWCGR